MDIDGTPGSASSAEPSLTGTDESNPTTPLAPVEPAARTRWTPPVFGRPRRPSYPRWLPLAGIGAAVALALLGLLVWWSAQSAVVRVPSLAGMDQASATARLQEVGLRLKVGDRRFSATVLRGSIVDQNPAAGAKVTEGSLVVVAVSAGSEAFAMPDVVGMPLDQARKSLRARGLSVTVQSTQSDKPQGTVLASFPSPGVIVSTGDKVRITVAAGGGSENALLPTDLTGRTFVIDPAPLTAAGEPDTTMDVGRRVRALLEASGARVVVTREITDSGEAISTLERSRRAKETSSTALVGLSIVQSGESGLGVLSVPATTTTQSIFIESASLATAVSKELRASFQKVGTSQASNDPIVTASGVPAVRIRLGSTGVAADRLLFADPQWADDVARAVYRALSSVYGAK